MDITTLALAKAYTDEEIKKVSTGGVDLSGYAKLEDIPTIQDIINALPKAEEEEF
jgi:hypothetical protein